MGFGVCFGTHGVGTDQNCPEQTRRKSPQGMIPLDHRIVRKETEPFGSVCATLGHQCTLAFPGQEILGTVGTACCAWESGD
jgi:hypothetical protein